MDARPCSAFATTRPRIGGCWGTSPSGSRLSNVITLTKFACNFHSNLILFSFSVWQNCSSAGDSTDGPFLPYPYRLVDLVVALSVGLHPTGRP
jgi:hypothetical protein